LRILFKKFHILEYENDNIYSSLPCNLAVMAITDFFQEFLKIVIQENLKIPNFEYKSTEEFQHAKNITFPAL
jgi:hypothetical protein